MGWNGINYYKLEVILIDSYLINFRKNYFYIKGNILVNILYF